MQKVFVDTNILLKTDKFKFEDFEKVYLSILTVEELDGLKKSEEIGYLAHQATDSLKEAKNKEIRLTFSDNLYGKVVDAFLDHKNDNYILATAYDVWTEDNDVVFMSDDYNLILKAEAIGLPCQLFEYAKTEPYKGYITLSGDTDFINKLYDDLGHGINEYELVTNEYLLLTNTDTGTNTELRFDGKNLVPLRLPDSKVIKGKNSLQRFALDLLNNKDIPIKIVAGGFGSGKTMMAVKVGLDLVTERETYKNITFIRNPVVTDGAEIGFLPGDKAEKIADFCRPFLQYIESPKSQSYAENLIRDDKIRMDVTSFLKGVSIDDSFVIMDEAEDLNTKLIKLVGSRIGDKSCVVFTGDWKQSEGKYKRDSGLLKLIKQGKGNKLVGIVVLEEDLRSSASKVFAELQ